jgi:hypothetical protein
MTKEVKRLRKQAEKAERLANSVKDEEVSNSYADLAGAYRAQADILKKRKRCLARSKAWQEGAAQIAHR